MRRYLDGEIDTDYPEQQNLTQMQGDESETQSENGESDEDGSVQKLLEQGESPECPECNEMALKISEGCKTCAECGWSEC
jgi:ribonucleoside-diphosphate reductase alpha chain